jgi:hypothetical protein
MTQRVILFFILATSHLFTAYSAEKPKLNQTMIVEVSCGQCQFNLPGKGCDLAIRIKGKAYYVDGTKIDNHGNAHAKNGFCNAILKARVKGHIKDGRFSVETFKLVSAKKEKSKK